MAKKKKPIAMINHMEVISRNEKFILRVSSHNKRAVNPIASSWHIENNVTMPYSSNGSFLYTSKNNSKKTLDAAVDTKIANKTMRLKHLLLKMYQNPPQATNNGNR